MHNFVGPGCDVTAGNSLTQLFDAVVNDPRQMGPKGPAVGPQGQMFDPTLASPMDAAWGMPMGMHMADQFRAHMQHQAGPSAGFYDLQSRGADWSQEFAHRMPMPMGPQLHAGPMATPMQASQVPFSSHGPMATPIRPSQVPFSSHRPMAMMPMPMRPIGPAPVGPMPMYSQRAGQPDADVMQPQERNVQTTPTPADMVQASQMVEMLKASGNPKFANSAFVKFIDRVSKGDLTFQNNKVIDAAGKELDWDAIYDEEVGQASPQDVADLDRLWKQVTGPSSSTLLDPVPGEMGLDQLFSAAAGGEHVDFDTLDQEQWNQQLEGAWNEATGNLQDVWGAGDLDNVWNPWQGPRVAEYSFAADNSYTNVESPLELAQRLIAEGRDREAILALEAEVQANPDSSEGWRQLGQLWAQMDQDVEAIQCLRRGHEADPYNLDSLLALGVSCTNELDQIEALKYLREWIAHHDEFSDLLRGMPDPNSRDLESLRDQVTNLFNAASDLNSNDPDVFVALGVIENLNRSFGAAAMALAHACRLRPNDFTCWNKLGATLANSGRSEDALVAYHQALSLKPNYARTWANLAIAHANLGEHVDAARFYLSSLTLNPTATHIWTFLHTAMLNAGRFDTAVTDRNLEACKALIPGSLDIQNMPTPLPSLAETAEDILGRINI